MNKLYLCTVWLCGCLAIPAWAQKPKTSKVQTITYPSKQDVFRHKILPKAQTGLLSTISQRLVSTPVLRAQFTQTKKLKALRFPLRSTGYFLFSQKKGIFWQLKAPFPGQFKITSKGITQRAAGEVTHIDGKNKPIIYGFTRMFLSIFSGRSSELHRHFYVYCTGTASAWTIGLRPKGTLLRKIFKSIVLSGSRTIRHVQMNERSGDRTMIQFTKVQTSPKHLTPKEQQWFR